MLASGNTSKATAEALSVTPKTLCQWNSRIDFRALVDQLLADTQADAIRALNGLSTRAVERLAELLASKNEGAAQRAIETVLDRAAGNSTPATTSTGDAWTSIIQRLNNEVERAQSTQH